MSNPTTTTPPQDPFVPLGIPALSPTLGVSNLTTSFASIELQNDEFMPHGAWRKDEDDWKIARWLHIDVKDVAYYYIYPLFEKIIEDGGLK